jgi:hypothetical protein
LTFRAKRCTEAFGHRGVKVTTKHSYAIDYKYIWECESCGLVYKRHSKSIDPKKHRCGSCKSSLVQTKPTPRNTKTTDYQLFVKENFQRIKKEQGNGSHGVVMETIGKLYREKKAKESQTFTDSTSVDIDALVKEVEVIDLDD